jgi:hypothetical protein
MKQEHLHKRRGDERVASDTFVTNVLKANSDGRSPKKFWTLTSRQWHRFASVYAKAAISERRLASFLTHD